ncbi:MAG: IclR family transcriptional regulator [Rhodospirillaceae bacterium]|nr:MAG: IclR family transcriptional regulator [Rhodospirillaceae bacterium]
MAIASKEIDQGLAGPRAMSRVLRLFSVLADEKAGFSLAALAAELQVPKSTLRNSLLPLLADGYLIASEARYRLGPRAYRLAAQMMAGWSLQLNVRPFMQELSRQTGESVGVAQIDCEGGRFVFVDAVESQHGVRFVIQVGGNGVLYAGASGRVLLAFQPEEYREQYLRSGPFAPITNRTTIDPDRLRSVLEKIRKTGVAVALGETVKDGAALSAPIFGPRGDLIAALTVAGPIARLEAHVETIKQQLLATARAASGGSLPLVP